MPTYQIAGLVILALILLRLLSRRGIKNRMRKTAHIKEGAEVVSVSPKIHKGPDGMFAYVTADVVVEFSDGSYYCTAIGHTRPYRTFWHRRGTQLSVSESDIRGAVYDAINAHEKVARERVWKEREKAWKESENHSSKR